MLKGILALFVVAFAIILGLAAMKPANYEVERSMQIAATPEKIAPLLDNFHNWNEWSPWAKMDPNMKTSYGGPQSGPGATYDWRGNKKVGEGHMEIVSVEPSKTTVDLNFVKPFKSHNTTEFVLIPGGGGTLVTWRMMGRTSFMTKVMLVFTSMDKMVGPDFDRGLASLKTAAER